MSPPADRRPGPAPYRLSDHERDEAVAVLGDAYAQGRLDHEEFELRMSTASRAVFASELDPLFDDLPLQAPHVVRAMPTQARPARSSRAVGTGQPSAASTRGAWPTRPFWPALYLPVVALVVVALATHLWLLLIPAFFWAKASRHRAWPPPSRLGHSTPRPWVGCGPGRR